MDEYARQIESHEKRIVSHEKKIASDEKRIASDAKLISCLRARLMKFEGDQQPLDQTSADTKDFSQLKQEQEQPMAAASHSE